MGAFGRLTDVHGSHLPWPPPEFAPRRREGVGPVELALLATPVLLVLLVFLITNLL
jgi:hypothetical protein